MFAAFLFRIYLRNLVPMHLCITFRPNYFTQCLWRSSFTHSLTLCSRPILCFWDENDANGACLLSFRIYFACLRFSWFFGKKIVYSRRDGSRNKNGVIKKLVNGTIGQLKIKLVKRLLNLNLVFDWPLTNCTVDQLWWQRLEGAHGCLYIWVAYPFLMKA